MFAVHAGVVSRVKNAVAWVPTNSTAVKLWSDAQASKTYQTSIGAGTRIATLANYIVGRPVVYSDYGPVVKTSTYFPSNLPVVEFVDDITYGNSADGIYSRLFESVSDVSIAGSSVAAVFSGKKSRDTPNGRMFSYGPTNQNDFDIVGCWWIQTDTGGVNYKFQTRGSDASYPTVLFSVPQFQPFDVRVDVDSNAIATVFINSVSQGSIPLGAVLSPTNTVIGYGRAIAYDGDLWYGQLACTTAQFGTHTTNDDNKLAGYRSWYSMGNGSLLPAGHPYKNRPPLISDP